MYIAGIHCPVSIVTLFSPSLYPPYDNPGTLRNKQRFSSPILYYCGTKREMRACNAVGAVGAMGAAGAVGRIKGRINLPPAYNNARVGFGDLLSMPFPLFFFVRRWNRMINDPQRRLTRKGSFYHAQRISPTGSTYFSRNSRNSRGGSTRLGIQSAIVQGARVHFITLHSTMV